MKISKITLFQTKIPLKIRVKHSLTDVFATENIFVKVFSEKYSGFGESVPKTYSSATSPEQTFETVKKLISDDAFKGLELNNLSDIDDFIQEKIEDNSAKCAVELAMIDLFAKEKRVNASDLFGGNKRDEIFYSPVITKKSLLKSLLLAFMIRLSGFSDIKVKVGFADDIFLIRLIRKILGRKVVMRADANCAWDSDICLKKINELHRAGVAMIEQPVGGWSDLERIINKSPIPVLIDESVRTLKDAEDVLKISGEKKIVLKLSKNGGFFNTKRIYERAEKNNTHCILSSQVGETGLLSAAGRLFAFICRDLYYVEGCYGKYLFKEDVTEEKPGFGFKGRAYPLKKNGLGVTVNEKVLEKFTTEKFEKEMAA